MADRQTASNPARTPNTNNPSEQRERGIARQETRGGLAGPRTSSFSSSAERRSSPFSLMQRMIEDMDRLYGDLSGRSLAVPEEFNPALEVFERDGKMVVRADLPGIKREDVRVHVDDGGLVIEGERKSEHEETREGFYQSERTYGSFSRRIALPRGSDPQKCDARFHDGVLEVCIDIPKESRRSIEVRPGEPQPTGPRSKPH